MTEKKFSAGKNTAGGAGKLFPKCFAVLRPAVGQTCSGSSQPRAEADIWQGAIMLMWVCWP